MVMAMKERIDFQENMRQKQSLAKASLTTPFRQSQKARRGIVKSPNLRKPDCFKTISMIITLHLSERIPERDLLIMRYLLTTLGTNQSYTLFY